MLSGELRQRLRGGPPNNRFGIIQQWVQRPGCSTAILANGLSVAGTRCQGDRLVLVRATISLTAAS